MNFSILVDMNLSPDWVAFLQSHGHTAVHWSTVGDIRALDPEIMEWARNNGHIVLTHDLDFGLFSVFHPGVMPEGEKFPLITWGNGTCAMPEGYGPLLRYVASFGYIVVAPNSVQVGGGAHQRAGIDFMLAENDNPMSKYYQKIDVEKIGAMGHSQGSGATAAAAAADSRIKAVILWNGGTSANVPYLAVSGDRRHDRIRYEEHVWGTAIHRVVADGISPEQAVDEAIARIKQILSE